MQQAETSFSIPTPVIFTDSAATRVKELIDEEGNPTLMLRVFITGGGCSGFQYGFTFEESMNPDDTVIEKSLSQVTSQADAEEGDNDKDGGDGSGGSQSVKLLIDPMSLQYLFGAEIDYKSDASGEQFIIRNPQAKTTCGCGSSFAIDN